MRALVLGGALLLSQLLLTFSSHFLVETKDEKTVAGKDRRSKKIGSDYSGTLRELPLMLSPPIFDDDAYVPERMLRNSYCLRRKHGVPCTT